MKKVHTNKGFTLAELLIVVAIIAVMVAIAIPTFADQIEKSREATDLSNIRSAYADVVVRSLSNPDADITATVAAKQTVTGWTTTPAEVAGAALPATNAKSGGTFTILYTASTGKITIDGVEVKAATSITTGNSETPESESVTLATIQSATDWSTYITAVAEPGVAGTDDVGENWFVSDSPLTAGIAPGAGLTVATGKVAEGKSYYSLNSGYTLGS